MPETLGNSSDFVWLVSCFCFGVFLFGFGFCYYFIASESLSGSELKEYKEEYEK